MESACGQNAVLSYASVNWSFRLRAVSPFFVRKRILVSRIYVDSDGLTILPSEKIGVKRRQKNVPLFVDIIQDNIIEHP